MIEHGSNALIMNRSFYSMYSTNTLSIFDLHFRPSSTATPNCFALSAKEICILGFLYLHSVREVLTRSPSP